MSKYRNGIILSLLIFSLLFYISMEFYSGTIPLAVPMTILISHASFFHIVKEEKRYFPSLLAAVILIGSLIYSWPVYTLNQAKQEVIDQYNITITEESTMLLSSALDWNPFNSESAYHFSGGERKFLVIPDDGRVIVVKN